MNFVKYRPGLVGGHCIPVDPLYLGFCRFKAGRRDARHEFGLRREIDGMAAYVVRSLLKYGKRRPRRKGFADGRHPRKNIDDIRNSRIAEMVGPLERRDERDDRSCRSR